MTNRFLPRVTIRWWMAVVAGNALGMWFWMVMADLLQNGIAVIFGLLATFAIPILMLPPVVIMLWLKRRTTRKFGRSRSTSM